MSPSLLWAAEYWLSSGVLNEHAALQCVPKSPLVQHKRDVAGGCHSSVNLLLNHTWLERA